MGETALLLPSASSYRLNGRVRKKAMTSFERDRTLANLSPQLDYSVSGKLCWACLCVCVCVSVCVCLCVCVFVRVCVCA